jgi:drug/metabolite transporter (DMT)-like permease
LILPFSLVIEQPWQLSITAGPLLATLALGVASTGLATWVFFVVVANCGPNFLSLINYIIPALAFAAGALLLAEPVNSSQFLGLGVICAGIAISQRRRSRGF